MKGVNLIFFQFRKIGEINHFGISSSNIGIINLGLKTIKWVVDGIKGQICLPTIPLIHFKPKPTTKQLKLKNFKSMF
jgi:hypothetical protein